MATPTLPPGGETAEPTNVAKLRGLPWSIAGNATYTFFAQFTFFGSVFVLFLDALGLSKGQIGFLLSLLPFSGLLSVAIASAVARFGYKRTFLTAFGLRKVITAFILLTPWVLSVFGSQAALQFVTAIVALFAILRAVSETAYLPWVQEYVPNSVRGKYSAANNVYATLAGMVAVLLAGLAIQRTSGLLGFMLLMGAGVLFGLISVWAFSFVPGGAPASRPEAGWPPRDLKEALQDREFLLYLTGVSLLTLGTVPLGSFLPLYMQEQVGLNPGNVILLQMGTLVGSLLSSYLWGWAADRYGSKPVMLSGLFLLLFLPVAWWLMPRHTPWSLPVALGIAVVQGLANLGWGIGASRLLFVNIVPPEKKADYMAVYTAWIGLIGGLSQMAGGWLLDLSQGIRGQVGVFILDPYLPLLLLGLVLPVASILLLRKIRAEVAVGVGEFAGIFLRGNPFLAMSSLVRYHLARDEYATVLMTERLGQARSRLTVQELLEALTDPRFHVRLEAIITISRTRRDPRLTQALIGILNGSELALSVIAAWALGRIRDRQALEPLHAALDSPFRSIQVHAARALGALGDREIVPELQKRLRRETDKGLRMAYAAALGNLEAAEATEDLLALLRETQNEGARMELALSLARIIGNEHHFIQLLRQVRSDPGTALSQAVSALKPRLGRQRLQALDPKLPSLLDGCAEALARADMAQGAALLGRFLRRLPTTASDPPAADILLECAGRMEDLGARRIEYLLLALHTLHAD